MVGQRRDRVGDLSADHPQQPVEFVVAQLGRDRVIALRLDPLPQHHLHPAIFGEQFLVAAKDAARFAEQLDLLLQAVGDRHVGTMPPERAVAARSEEHTSELQSLMRISYAVFCLKKKITNISKEKTKNPNT